MATRPFVTALVGAAVLGLLLGAYLAYVPDTREIEATVLPEPKPIPAFTLVDDHGESFSREHLEGKWTFAFFGYTHCPDICPNTLAHLDRLEQRLQDTPAADDTLFLFVSVDPRRDDPPRLGEYVAHFNDAFIGATGEPGALDGLTRALGLRYQVPDAPADSEYEVEHSSSVLLIGPDAGVRAYFQHPHDPARMAADYRRIREGAAG